MPKILVGDWITQMNELAERRGDDDRSICEYMIMFLNKNVEYHRSSTRYMARDEKLGDVFVSWYERKGWED